MRLSFEDNKAAVAPRSRVSAPDITAMVDVVFLLIIFFLTTSSLAQMTRAKLELTEARGEDAAQLATPGLVVNITAEGEYLVDNSTVGIERLSQMLRAEVAREGLAANVEVLIRADRNAPLAHVNDVAEQLIDLGVVSWRLATEIPPPNTAGPPAAGGGAS
jgi:biopolymer transport protein ExbD